MDIGGNLLKEWNILISAPGTFVFALILAFGAAYFIVRLRYESALKSRDQEIERLKRGNT